MLHMIGFVSLVVLVHAGMQSYIARFTLRAVP